MLRADRNLEFHFHFTMATPWHRIEIRRPEVHLSWKRSPFFSMSMSENTPFWRHIDSVLASSHALLTFKRHFPVTKADVLYIYKKTPPVKSAGGTCQDGVLMTTMRCARRHARGHKLQRWRHGVGLLVDLYFVTMVWIVFYRGLFDLKARVDICGLFNDPCTSVWG